MVSLINKLQTLETTHKQTPTRQLGVELDMVRTQITELLHFKAKATMKVFQKKVYKSGNKCGKLLAQTLQAQKSASYIPPIVSPTGQKLTLPQQITK